MRAFVKIFFSLTFTFLLAGCESPKSLFRADSHLAFQNLPAEQYQSVFPVEYSDLKSTLELAETEFSRSEMANADNYYSLVILKAGILEKQYNQELIRREEVARQLAAKKLQEERELEEKRVALEKEKAVEQARILELQQRKEAEQAEAKKRAERQKVEREIQLVARHTVKRGETLPQIAALQEVYGDSSLWPLIYKANRDQISDPAVLWPGQVLRIPRNFERGELNDARRFSNEKAIR